MKIDILLFIKIVKELSFQNITLFFQKIFKIRRFFDFIIYHDYFYNFDKPEKKILLMGRPQIVDIYFFLLLILNLIFKINL